MLVWGMLPKCSGFYKGEMNNEEFLQQYGQTFCLFFASLADPEGATLTSL